MLIQQEREVFGNGYLRYLTIKLMVESSAIKSPLVALSITFNIDSQGNFRGLNTTISQSLANVNTNQLSALLEAVKNWDIQ